MNNGSQRRPVYAAVTALIALSLISILVYLLTSTPQAVMIESVPAVAAQAAGEETATETATETVTTADTTVTNSASNASSLPESAADSVNTTEPRQEIVMRINDETVDLAEFLHIYQLNRVMDIFAAQEARLTAQDQLDQLLSAKLVAQAAKLFGFQLPTTESEQALTQWLTAHQKTQADLQETLNVNGFTMDEFSAHFHQLYWIDTYLRQQETIYGHPREELLEQLHQQAKISFGTAVNAYLTATPTVYQTAYQETEGMAMPSQAEGAQSKSVPTDSNSEQPAVLFTQFPDLAQQELMYSQNAMPSDTAPGITTGMTTSIPSVQAISPAAATPVPFGLAPGNRAPIFSLPSLDAEESVQTLSDWHGSPVVLSFWTTWCPYCRKQTPVLVAANQLTTTDHIQFIGINVNESVTAVESYIQTENISYPILLDADGEVANNYAVRGYPTTYFLDADGHIVDKHVGALSETQLSQYLARFTP